MPEEMDIIKLNAIKSYYKTILKSRVSDTAANDLRATGSQIMKDVMVKANDMAKEDSRDTTMPRDMTPAMEQFFGNKVLTVAILLEGVRKLNPVQLGEFSKGVTAYIDELKKSDNP